MIPGTSNLYVYFVVKIISDLKPGGQFSCILYDSWQSIRYGASLVDYLNENCSSIQFEAVPNQPFHGRLINATILYGTKRSKSPKVLPNSVTFSELFHQQTSRCGV